MGCGKAHIFKYFAAKSDPRFHFVNYDHVTKGDNVISQDISQTPLDDASAEIVVMSLAMWGSNCHSYVREAYRILETGGQLYMAEATKRWSQKDDRDIVISGSEGGLLRRLLEDTGFQVLSATIKKFSFFICSK